MSLVSRDRWKKLCEAVGVVRDADACFDRLTVAYSEPHRRYHNLRHIAECHEEFEAVRAGVPAPESIELAIWFHDAVYDTKAGDNEERSAKWAMDFLVGGGASHSLAGRVSNLVLATKKHEVHLDSGAPVLVDVDLSILGQPEKRFWEYERQIREEYSWVHAAVFAEKRAEILETFLKRERIYSTDWFFERYENQARKNLQASIDHLRS